jgi:hypothetical protein
MSGKMTTRLHNAPYSYSRATTELKILIDSCSTWLTLGGSNIGPIKKNKITSNSLYSDANTNKLFTDVMKGPLSNFSLTVLYTYFDILKNSVLNNYIDLYAFKSFQMKIMLDTLIQLKI